MPKGETLIQAQFPWVFKKVFGSFLQKGHFQRLPVRSGCLAPPGMGEIPDTRQSFLPSAPAHPKLAFDLYTRVGGGGNWST